MDNNQLILIDGSAYLHRAFHALPPLMTSSGIPTGATYGVTSMLKSLLTEYSPEYIAIVFDTKGKTFREELYPLYKAQRAAPDEQLIQQISWLHAIVEALGFPLLLAQGVEADDVIGTLAKQAEISGLQVLIFTGDKDFAQLVNDHIILIDTMKNERLDATGVKTKFGVSPEQFIDYLSLIGDQVDNVPGIDKVGPKTAVKWLQQYGSLDNIIANAEQFSGKIGENLRHALPQLPLTRRLLTIRCDLELPYKPQELKLMPANILQLRDLFSQLEFKQWLAELTPKKENFSKKSRYLTIFSQFELQQWVTRLAQAKAITLEIKANHTDYLEAQLIGIAFAMTSDEVIYIPLAHDYLGAPPQLSRDQVLSILKPLLENPTCHKIGHDLKFIAHVLANHGIKLQGITFDTLLESYVLDSAGKQHDRDSLSLKYLGEQISTVIGKNKKSLSFNQIDIYEATQKIAREVDITLQLHHILWEKIQETQTLEKVLTTIEIPLIPVLLAMERHGVEIDTHLLYLHSLELTEQLHTLEKQIYDLTGEKFNINSPKQLQAILFEKLKLPTSKKTAKGSASTAVDVLEELATDYPLAAHLLNYRSISKLKSTYTDALPQQINLHTGRIHTCYHQAVTTTGRLSSSDPNLQNIPIRTAEGRRIRQAFIASNGYRLLAADYSQIELRLMAHLSDDDNLLKAFHQGQDIHQQTAAEVFKIEPNAVTAEQRRKSKIINFGLMYGMGATSLAKQLNVERREAQSYIDTYFARYPKVKNYMETTRELAKTQGYVETLFGRRLAIPEIHSRNAQRQQYAERSAINAPLQGSSADLIKLAMIAIHQWIEHQSLDILLLMQVHDELVFQVPEAQLTMAIPAITQAMTDVMTLKVPLVVEIGVGKNWNEAH
ncbi:MAG: DNA polymerase I [Beggiatoa sp. IS2]|nr:MAG: DNA polymerase I [Beggiatoa sp. IS2]